MGSSPVILGTVSLVSFLGFETLSRGPSTRKHEKGDDVSPFSTQPTEKRRFKSPEPPSPHFESASTCSHLDGDWSVHRTSFH